MFCPNCGKQLSDGAAFCAGCGRQLGSKAPTAQPTRGAAPQSAAAQGAALQNARKNLPKWALPAAGVVAAVAVIVLVGNAIKGGNEGGNAASVAASSSVTGQESAGQQEETPTFESDWALFEQYLADCNVDAAEEQLLYMYETYPDNEDLYLQLGELYAEKEDYDNQANVLLTGYQATGSERIKAALQDAQMRGQFGSETTDKINTVLDIAGDAADALGFGDQADGIENLVGDFYDLYLDNQ